MATTLQIISLVSSILSPVLMGLAMWGYKSDQKSTRDNISKNTAAIEKIEMRHSERMDKIEASYNDLRADLPHVYVLREDFIRVLNNVDSKLDKLLNTPKGE